MGNACHLPAAITILRTENESTYASTYMQLPRQQNAAKNDTCKNMAICLRFFHVDGQLEALKPESREKRAEEIAK